MLKIHLVNLKFFTPIIVQCIAKEKNNHTFNPLSAELIFLFSSYSAYLIARFAFFSVSIIFTTAKFCGKVPDGQFQTFNSRERNFA